ncbi:tyrosine-type recombinase/integrase [Anaerobacillus alkalilacustris]|nr:tyrosine-type recombinase/integrase [Anaerobacillus alkalilacustris]
MELVHAWATMRPTESQSGFRRRLSPLREFGKYLNAIGIDSYVIPSNYTGGKSSFIPYIFTDEELIAIFTEADRLNRNKNTPNRHLIVPALLRMIYFCGLRPNEGREIKKTDVDLDSGILFIRKNKTHRERIVPMSDDLRNFCIDYNEKLKIFSPNSEYFFPNPDGIPYSAKWLTQQFLSIWERTQPVQYTTRVRVYDLRHRFASAVMMNWLNKGADLYAKLPYLSTYMGHAKFSDTAYYIHLLPTNLTRSNAIDWDSFLELIPEVSPW